MRKGHLQQLHALLRQQLTDVRTLSWRHLTQLHTLRQQQMQKQFETELANQKEAADRGGLDLQRKQTGEVRQQPRNIKVRVYFTMSFMLVTCALFLIFR